MTNTPFSNKCAILAQAYGEWAGSDLWTPFFQEYDLGFVFAFGVSHNMITVNDDGTDYIEQAWIAFCDRLGLDYYGEYDSLDHMLELDFDE